MEFTLNLITINTPIKEGYYILHNNKILSVIKVDKKSNTGSLSDKFVYSLADLENCVAKFIGIYKGQTYSIKHGDFQQIVEFLQSDVQYTKDTPDDKKIYNTYLEGLLNGAVVTISGAFDTILTRTIPGENVIISNIDIIDKYSLYEKESRIALVTKFNKVKHTFEVKLSTNEFIKVNREDFRKINENNTRTMIRCVCEKCGK